MKRNVFLTATLAIALVFALSLSSCATASSINGTSDPHGIFVSQARTVSNNGTEIASYTVILGLIDDGYDRYAAAVQAATDEGKQINTVTTWYYFFSKVTAYAK